MLRGTTANRRNFLTACFQKEELRCQQEMEVGVGPDAASKGDKSSFESDHPIEKSLRRAVLPVSNPNGHELIVETVGKFVDMLLQERRSDSGRYCRLLSGPQGIGKTTQLRALCDHINGDDRLKELRVVSAYISHEHGPYTLPSVLMKEVTKAPANATELASVLDHICEGKITVVLFVDEVDGLFRDTSTERVVEAAAVLDELAGLSEVSGRGYVSMFLCSSEPEVRDLLTDRNNPPNNSKKFPAHGKLRSLNPQKFMLIPLTRSLWTSSSQIETALETIRTQSSRTPKQPDIGVGSVLVRRTAFFVSPYFKHLNRVGTHAEKFDFGMCDEVCEWGPATSDSTLLLYKLYTKFCNINKRVLHRVKTAVKEVGSSETDESLKESVMDCDWVSELEGIPDETVRMISRHRKLVDELVFEGFLLHDPDRQVYFPACPYLACLPTNHPFWRNGSNLIGEYNRSWYDWLFSRWWSQGQNPC